MSRSVVPYARTPIRLTRAISASAAQLLTASTLFDFEVMLGEAVWVVAGRHHPLLQREQLELSDLVAWPWILYPPATAIRQLFEESFADAGVPAPPSMVETPSIFSTLELLQATEMLSLQPRARWKNTWKRGLVFVNPLHGDQWTGDKQVRGRWGRILKIAGVKHRNLYRTRPTFASSMLMLGKNPMYVATQLGHVDTTMISKIHRKWIEGGIDGDKKARLESLYADFTQKSND